MKEGNIIFLTRAKGNWWNWRVILTYITASLSTKERSKIDTVFNHTAIIFSYNNMFYVRDMDYNGNTSYLLSEYLNDYKGRITIKENPFIIDKTKLDNFNTNCRYLDVEYDFFNLLFFQLIKVIFGSFIGKDTINHRTCTEDTSTMFNSLVLNYFKRPEQITPVEINEVTKDWKIVLKA